MIAENIDNVPDGAKRDSVFGIGGREDPPRVSAQALRWGHEFAGSDGGFEWW